MTTTNEVVFWGFRPSHVWGGAITEAFTQYQEMLLTSVRMILQNIPSREKTYRVVSKLVFGPLLAPSSEAFTGSPKFTIDPKRITESIAYDEISEVEIESNTGVSIATVKVSKIGQGKPCLTFNLGSEHLESCYRILFSMLGNRLKSNLKTLQKPSTSSQTGMLRLAPITLSQFCSKLANIGLTAEPLDRTKADSAIGIMKINNCNFSLLIKDSILASCLLEFVVVGATNKNRNDIVMDLKKEEGKLTGIEWRGSDEKLIQTLCKDMNQIYSLVLASNVVDAYAWYLRVSGIIKKERINVHSQLVTIENSVHIRNGALDFMPPVEYFKLMDRISFHLHPNS